MSVYTSGGRTPLHLAVHVGKIEMVTLLVQCG